MAAAQQEWRNDAALRNTVKQRFIEALQQKHAGMLPAKAIAVAETIESSLLQKATSHEMYISNVGKMIGKVEAAQMHHQQPRQPQQQLPQQQLPQQQIPQQQLPQQLPPQQQPVTIKGQLYQGQSDVGMQPQSNMFRPMQPGQAQNTIIQQTSSAQGMQIRQRVPMKPNTSPMQRPIMQGTVPSPQSSFIGNYRPQQWSQPSPGNQYYPGSFAQPRQSVPVNSQQPVLTMPDSMGAPHGSVIPSLSPAHQSPQVPTTSPSLKTPGSVQAAPSPGSLTLSTIPSPASVSQPQAEDDKEYMEKLKQLQKYIEPLSRMISKFTEDEETYNKDLSKMKNLRDTLINPKKRLALSTLDKCEKVLRNWLDKPTPQAPQPPPPHQHMCQPILNVIASATKSPLLNHTLKRTFGPAMQTICGEYTIPDYLPTKKQCFQNAVKEIEERKRKELIPGVVQGELSRLDDRFNVKLDESHHSEDGDIKILCTLVDHQLPSVAPLRISIPKSYPEQCPVWLDKPLYYTADVLKNAEKSQSPNNQDSEKSSNSMTFEQNLQKIMQSRLTRLTDSSTISSLIKAWETSIREALSVTS